MSTNRRSQAAAYLIAFCSILFAAIFKLILVSELATDTPFILFYGAIVITTWYGGLAPGIFASGLCVLLSIFFFLPPYYTLTLSDPESLFRISLFLFETTIIVYLIHSLRKTREDNSLPQTQTPPTHAKDDALLLDMIQITAPIGMGFWDTQLRYVRVNPVMAALSGMNPAAHTGRTVLEVLPELGEGMQYSLKTVLETGMPILNQEIAQTRQSIFGETQQHFLMSYYRVRDSHGKTFGVSAILVDITERKKAEEEKAKLIDDLQRRREQLDFLMRASEILNSSLDYEATLRSLAALTVPTIADWCAVDILDTNGLVQRLAVTHIDPEKVSWAYELNRKYPPKPDDPRGVYHLIRRGEPELYADIPDELLVTTVENPEVLEIIRSLGLKSAMNLPLTARGRGLGMLQLVMAESGRHYSHEDFILGQELAQRAAIAIDNARLFREATRSND